jgi:hypothetical protein
LWAEIAPAAPIVIEALVPLIQLCIIGTFLALIFATHHVVTALGNFVSRLVGHLPLIGTASASLVHQLENTLVSPLANAERYLDNRIGTAWHRLARVWDRLGGEIERLAFLSLLLTKAIFGGLNNHELGQLKAIVVHWLDEAIHKLHGALHFTVTHTTYVYKTVTTHVLPTLGRISHSVAVDLPRELDRLRSRERALAHEVDVTIPRDIEALRRREKALTDNAIGLFRWLRTHPTAAASAAFAGAVAVALRTLGLEWTRCNSARSLFNKRGCGLWNDLDSLLGFLADVAIVASICDVIPLLESAFAVFAAPLISTIASAGAGLCSPGSSPPETLPPPGLVLPANPGYTLTLP